MYPVDTLAAAFFGESIYTNTALSNLLSQNEKSDHHGIIRRRDLPQRQHAPPYRHQRQQERHDGQIARGGGVQRSAVPHHVQKVSHGIRPLGVAEDKDWFLDEEKRPYNNKTRQDIPKSL